MITLKNGIRDVLLIISSLYLVIKCSPVYDLNTNIFNLTTTANFTENDDLIVVDQGSKNDQLEFFFDDQSVDEFGSGNADIIINLKSPLYSAENESNYDELGSGYGDLIIALKSPLKQYSNNTTIVGMEEDSVDQGNNAHEMASNEDAIFGNKTNYFLKNSTLNAGNFYFKKM